MPLRLFSCYGNCQLLKHLFLLLEINLLIKGNHDEANVAWTVFAGTERIVSMLGILPSSTILASPTGRGGRWSRPMSLRPVQFWSSRNHHELITKSLCQLCLEKIQIQVLFQTAVFWDLLSCSVRPPSFTAKWGPKGPVKRHWTLLNITEHDSTTRGTKYLYLLHHPLRQWVWNKTSIQKCQRKAWHGLLCLLPGPSRCLRPRPSSPLHEG